MAGLFLTIIWLVIPFVIFNIKLRCDEISNRLSTIESRLVIIEAKMIATPDRYRETGNSDASTHANQDVLQ